MARPTLSPIAWEVWVVRPKASLDLATGEKRVDGSSFWTGMGVNLLRIEELGFRV